MIIINDIVLNLKNRIYMYYEWDINDEIVEIESITCVKISKEKLMYLCLNKFRINNELLKKIKNKTKIRNLESKMHKYCVVLFCDETSYAFEFDDSGLCVGKSTLLYDEEMDLLKKGKKNKEEFIEYEIV